MTSPVDSAIPATGEGPRSGLTDLLKSRYAVVMTSLTELRGADLSGHRFAWLLSTGKLYKFDAASMAADDGVTVIVDTAGNRFLLIAEESLFTFSGSGDPGAGLGENGDTYYKTASATVWVKEDGSWAEGASIKGADGEIQSSNDSINNAVALTQAEFDALTPAAKTIYHIIEEE